MSSLQTRLKGRSELGLAALLGAVGLIVILNAVGIKAPYSQSDPVGPQTVPYIVGALLLVCGVLLTVNVLRGGQGEAEGGEDVDLTHPSDWRTVVPLIVAFVLNILLIDIAGWVISGAILFWGSVWALGSRHYVRDAIVSVLLAVGTFYGFYVGLGIRLPAGLLKGVL
jgi:putative tricarboxylic transport membrane protein